MPIKRPSYVNVLVLARLNAPDFLVMDLHLVLKVQLAIEKQHVTVPVRCHDTVGLHNHKKNYIISHVSHLGLLGLGCCDALKCSQVPALYC